MSTPRLFTIGPSHYCDKARWALERAGVAYEERPCAPVVHFGTMLFQGQRTTPLLVTDAGPVRSSAEIVAYADRLLPSGAKLIPEDPALRAEALAFAERCDRELGPAVRRLMYFYLFQDLPLLTEVVCAPRLPKRQAAAFRAGRRGIVALMRRGMRIDAEGARRSEEKIERLAEDVDARLSKGGRFLFGDRFSTADLTFAALFGPLVQPPRYGWPLPPLDAIGPELRARLAAYRARPCGAFALRMYDEERAPRG